MQTPFRNDVIPHILTLVPVSPEVSIHKEWQSISKLSFFDSVISPIARAVETESHKMIIGVVAPDFPAHIDNDAYSKWDEVDRNKIDNSCWYTPRDSMQEGSVALQCFVTVGTLRKESFTTLPSRWRRRRRRIIGKVFVCGLIWFGSMVHEIWLIHRGCINGWQMWAPMIVRRAQFANIRSGLRSSYRICILTW